MLDSEVTITAADAADLPAITALLERVGLTTMGLEASLAAGWLARDAAGEVVGCAVLEKYGRAALLRSVAVAPMWQSHGIGRALVAAAVAETRALGVDAIYLLTETAEAFFASHGFERVERPSVPEAVRASVEFTSACPASAVAMSRQLALAPPAAADYN
jgi:amino-acid N-acetyltransferase